MSIFRSLIQRVTQVLQDQKENNTVKVSQRFVTCHRDFLKLSYLLVVYFQIFIQSVANVLPDMSKNNAVKVSQKWITCRFVFLNLCYLLAVYDVKKTQSDQGYNFVCNKKAARLLTSN